MARVYAHTFRDFTGGLNLAADPANIEDNESPDMLNVEPLAAGGLGPRRSVRRMHATALGAQPKSIWTYETVAGVKQVMVSHGTSLAYSTGGNFTAVGSITQTTGLRHRAATLINKCYIVNGTDQCVKWDGTTGTRLTVTGFNDDFAAPDDGNFPLCKYVAVFADRMFAAWTIESSVNYSSRIRWSHPTNTTATKGPEDWRTDDFIDIDIGKDGDEIVGLVPLGERLAVIKRNGIYLVSGFDQNTFQVFPLTQNIGACGPDAFVVDEEGLHVFSWPTGVWTIERSGKIRHRWQFLQEAIRVGSIADGQMDKISLGSSNGRLWVGLPWAAATTANRAFLLDRNVGKSDCWSFHSIDLGPMVEWTPTGGDTLLLAIDANTGTDRGLRVIKLDQDRFAEDLYRDTVEQDRDVHYQSAWVALGEPALPKRWKRAELLLRDHTHSKLFFLWLRDYDTTDSRPFLLETAVGTTAGVWDTGLWDTAVWGSALTKRDKTYKTSPPGRADAISLYFSGLDQTLSIEWEIHTVTLKYIPKRIR